MGNPADINRRLGMIDESCKIEIARKKTEIENKQRELREKQHLSGITKEVKSQYNQEIAKLQKELDGLSKNHMALSKLTSAIFTAFDEVQEWTPGITAAIEVVEQYSKHLKQSAGIDAVVTQCSIALNLLTEDIKSHSSDKGAGGRIISALQGIGLAVAGLLVCLFIPGLIMTTGHPRDLVNDVVVGIGNSFANAFKCFKETWTGKVEPRELKKLSHELKSLNKQYSQVTSVADHPHAFHTVKPSPEGTLGSIHEVGDNKMASQEEGDNKMASQVVGDNKMAAKVTR